MKVVRWLVGMGLILSAGLCGAATHPVPLDKNTDSAKCIECHQDKAKGKAVHSAIATGLHQLPRSPGDQRCHPRQAHHRNSVLALSYLPRRQERRRPERYGPSSGGSRLPEVSRSAHHRQQVPIAEADFGRGEREPLPDLPHSRDSTFPTKVAGTRRWTWVARLATSPTRSARRARSNSTIT